MVESVWESVSFERAVQWAAGIVAVEEFKVRVRGQTQVSVPAGGGVVRSGADSVGKSLKRVVVINVGLVCIFAVIISGPVEIVCEYVGSCAVSVRAAAVLCRCFSCVSQLGESSMKFRSIRTSPIRGGGAERLSHVAAAAAAAAVVLCG